jgi:hypothetical protein
MGPQIDMKCGAGAYGTLDLDVAMMLLNDLADNSELLGRSLLDRYFHAWSYSRDQKYAPIARRDAHAGTSNLDWRPCPVSFIEPVRF